MYNNLAAQHTVTLDVDEPWIKRAWPFRGTLTARAFTFPVALPATCKLIKQEAEPVLQRATQNESVEVLYSFPYKVLASGFDARVSSFLFHTLSCMEDFFTLIREVGWTDNEKHDLDKSP